MNNRTMRFPLLGILLLLFPALPCSVLLAPVLLQAQPSGIAVPATGHNTATETGQGTAGSRTGEDPAGKDASRCKFNHECGYWWGFKDTPKEQPAPRQADHRDTAGNQPAAKPCQSRDTWQEDCGFIDPQGDFEFLSMQRDRLSKHALMNYSDQSAVHAFQQFISWVVDASSSYARTWEYNMMQDQSINPFAKHPVSRFGLKASLRSLTAAKKNIFQEIAGQGGILVFWSREDCHWCHQIAASYRSLGKDTGIPVYNLSIRGNCIKGFSGEFCKPESRLNRQTARALNIQIVPDLFLLLDARHAGAESWVRVSTGMESVAVISSRIYTYFEAVRAASSAGMKAAANHFKDSQRPNATFDYKRFEPDISTYRKTGIPQAQP